MFFCVRKFNHFHFPRCRTMAVIESVEKQNGHYLSTSSWGEKRRGLMKRLEHIFYVKRQQTHQILFSSFSITVWPARKNRNKKTSDEEKWKLSSIYSIYAVLLAGGCWCFVFISIFFTLTRVRGEEKRTKFRWKHFHQRVQCRREFVLTHSSVANLLRR